MKSEYAAHMAMQQAVNALQAPVTWMTPAPRRPRRCYGLLAIARRHPTIFSRIIKMHIV